MQEQTKKTNAYVSYYEVKSLDLAKWKNKFSPAYWNYRKKWEENPVYYIVGQGPLHIVLEITTLCNLKCSFCLRTKMIKDGAFEQPIKHMDLELVNKTLDDMAACKVPSLALNGWGEPLLNPDLPAIIARAKKKGILDVFFHTNGTIMNEELAEKLIKAGLDKIIFSIDAPNAKIYQQRIKTFNTSYQDVENNVKLFLKVRKKLGYDFPITRVTMTLGPGILKKHLNEFVKRWHSHVEIISFQQFQKLLDKNQQYPVSTYNPKFVCPQLWHRLYICIDGLTLPCCGDCGYREMPVGHIQEQSIKEIWQSKGMNKIRQKMLQGQYYQLPACQKCSRPLDKGLAQAVAKDSPA